MAWTRSRPRLHVEDHAPPDPPGEPVLCLTGFAISAAIFEPLLPRYLDAGYRCILYDHRGSGRSAAPWRLTSMAELAWDAVRVLDHVGLESAHVYGVSFGGMVAQELALRFPHRVRGLVLVATTPGGPASAQPGLRQMGAVARGVAGELRSSGHGALAPALFSAGFRAEHPERVAALLPAFGAHRAPLHGVAGHWWSSVYHDTRARLPRVQAPTLVLHGDDDVMAPLGNARALAARIPDAELAVLSGAGHAAVMEQPQRSFEVFDAWMRRRSPIPAGRPPSAFLGRLEPVTRPFGLPIGALRTGRSLVGAVASGRRG